MKRASSLRLLLLLLVVTGVAGLHTIGHANETEHSASGHSLPEHMSDLVGGPSILLQATTLSRTDEPGPRSTLHSLDVCVAVLIVGFLVLLTTLVTRLRPGAMFDPVGHSMHAGGARGPPLPVQLGLRLADLSVRRT